MMSHSSIESAFHFGSDAEASARAASKVPSVSVRCGDDGSRATMFFYGATLAEAQAIADAINAAIKGARDRAIDEERARARAAADADALKIAAQ